MSIRIENVDALHLLKTIDSNYVDLILTDPPYAISRDSNLHVGTAKKYVNHRMDFGDWDQEEIDLDPIMKESYRVTKNGGTVIFFYDIWKITLLRRAMERAGFRMIRLVIWEKANPFPLNAKSNYLSNSREVAVLGVKGNRPPTFHSYYDGGIYGYPIPVNRGHPTQKPLGMFLDLIRKHSHADDIVVDPYLGSGTTAVAAAVCNRRFIGCDINNEYVEIACNWLQEQGFEYE